MSDFSGSRSRTEGSFPSRSKAFLTAPAGSPTETILKYFEYSGSSFNGGLSSTGWGVEVCESKLRSQSRSKIRGSTPSRCIAFRIAPSGRPTARIFVYFSYFGSSLMATPPESTLLSVGLFCDAKLRSQLRSTIESSRPSRCSAFRIAPSGRPTARILTYF